MSTWKRLRQFRDDMEEAGIEVRSYSGRGMFGRRTYGVNCDGRYGPTERQVLAATKVELRRDNLGLGSILYVHY